MTRSLEQCAVTTHVYSDASKLAYGGHWDGREVQSYFTEKQAQLSINSKELLAILYTLSSFAADLRSHHIMLHCDNFVSVCCIRRKGCSDPFRDAVTRQIFNLGKQHNFTWDITWLKSADNKLADKLSRKILYNPRTEISIPKELLWSYLSRCLDWTPEIDLFASALNHKMDKYCSRANDPGSYWIDSLTLNWHGLKTYCFCPCRLINAVLRKMDCDRLEHMVMLAPLHVGSAWFTNFMQHLKEPPFLLPANTARKLFLPWDSSYKHPLAKNMRMILGNLCARCYSTMDFQPGQPVILQTMDGETVQLKGTPLSRNVGSLSAPKRRKISTKWT